MSNFAVIRHYKRVWAIGSIRGDANRIRELHKEIVPRLQLGDRLIYLGNMIGSTGDNKATLDELLGFRRLVIAQPGMFASDVVYLRGQTEEIWHKLLQLQFASNPKEILPWMLNRGMEALITAYGGDVNRGLSAARDGAVAMTRWTGQLRNAIQATPGHWTLLNKLHHWACTDNGTMLFVHHGLDPRLPLDAQRDHFWWGSTNFGDLSHTAYQNFKKVVLGNNDGKKLNTEFTLSIDEGCGLGGKLAALCLDRNGQILDQISV